MLILSGSCLGSVLPDGSRRVTSGNVALDFAIINALGQGHWQETLSSPALAAENYALRKRHHEDTEDKCRAAGVHFIPMVVEAQGGMTAEAAGVFDGISSAVASAEGLPKNVIRDGLLERISLLLWRCSGQSIIRRLAQDTSEDNSAVKLAMDAARLLEAPSI